MGINDLLARLDGYDGIPEVRISKVRVPQPSILFAATASEGTSDEEAFAVDELSVVERDDEPLVTSSIDDTRYKSRESEETSQIRRVQLRGTGEIQTIKSSTARPSSGTYASRGELIAADSERKSFASISYLPTSSFVDNLVKTIEAVGYVNVEIQSIEQQDTTRVPFSVINFTYGDPNKLIPRQWFIKDYQGNEDIRDKDILLPAFMNELDIPAGKVVGFDLDKMQFEHRFALIEIPEPDDGVWYDQAGGYDYKSIIPKLNQRTLFQTGYNVIDLLAKMQVRATKNLNMLKTKYGLDLELTDHNEIITERLLDYVQVENTRLIEEFAIAYALLDKLETNGNVFFSHADYTPGNIRRGGSLSDYFIIDWQTARIGDYSTYDLRTLEVRTLSLRQDRDSIEDYLFQSYDDYYLQRVNEIASEEAPDLQLNKDDFHSDNYIEYIREHLYRIGDHIWTQVKYGQNDQRKFLSQWSLTKFLEAVDEGSEVSGKHREILLNLREKAVALLKGASNIDYLRF